METFEQFKNNGNLLEKSIWEIYDNLSFVEKQCKYIKQTMRSELVSRVGDIVGGVKWIQEKCVCSTHGIWHQEFKGYPNVSVKGNNFMSSKSR